MHEKARFLSLRGRTSILISFFAFISAAIAYFLIADRYVFNGMKLLGDMSVDMVVYLSIIGLVMITCSLISAILIAKKESLTSLSIWKGNAKFKWLNILLPLIGCVLLAGYLIFLGKNGLAMPIIILSYGAMLLSISWFVSVPVKVLGMAEFCLGVFAAFYTGYGLFYWILGFGIFHLILGLKTINKKIHKPT